MRLSNLLLAGPLLLAAPASAGDLIPQLIPADARWVAHVDVEAFLGSSLWQGIREQPEVAAELDQGLAEARGELGFDPLGFVKSVTAFGSSENPEEALAVLVVSQDVDELLVELRGKPEYSSQKLRGYAVDVWSQDDEAVYCHVREFDGIANRLVFVSDSSERLLRGIDVLEGRAQDVTQVSDARVAADPGQNSFFFVETSEDIPGLDQMAPVSAVAALAKGLRFEVGESAGQLFADLRVTTQNAKDAESVHAVLQGASSLLNLAMPKEVPAEVRQLIGDLQFGINGNQVGIEFRHDSRDLIRTLLMLQDMDH